MNSNPLQQPVSTLAFIEALKKALKRESKNPPLL